MPRAPETHNPALRTIREAAGLVETDVYAPVPVSIECDEVTAQNLPDFGLEDNIVFSTDYPHLDVKYPRAVETFLKLPFSEQTKRKYLWDNCARLYGLD
jgi:predicted TIM-barrel fold metal-dependent hydrolase